MPKNKTWRELRAETIATSERDAEVKAGAQAIISTLEHTDDVLLSTLTRYIEGLGGHIEIRAVFDDEAIELLS